jgi:ADP-ribose pyrophosphatase YjhB (NUDIX family)
LEAGETILEGILRETREEAGEKIQVRPLGVVHVHTFHYDENIQFMIGIYYLLASEGGQVIPGDDMRDSRHRWWHVDDLIAAGIQYHPSVHPWMLRRAVELYRLWKNLPDDAFLLQPTL